MRVALVLLLVGALSGCAAANADGNRTTTAELDGQTVRIDMPLEGDAQAVAIWFHGQGGDANFRMNEPWLNVLREDGWAVAAADLGGNHWGAPGTVEQVDALNDWIAAQTDAAIRLHIAGSMGALASLNAMRSGVPVGCWYGTMPVVDLASVAAVPDAVDQIAEAHNGQPADTSSPAAGLDQIPADTRYRVLYSPDDTWVPATSNALPLIESLEARGAEVEAVEVEGEHGHPSHFNADDLAAFAATC